MEKSAKEIMDKKLREYYDKFPNATVGNKPLIDVDFEYQESMKQYNHQWNPNKPELIQWSTSEKKDEVFGTGSRRDSSDHKPRVSDLKAYTRERFGYLLLKGSINYGTGNFEKGQPDDRTLESLHRHLTKYELGDNQEDHLSAVIFGIQNILLNEQKAGVPTDFYYQQYVASGEYEKDLERKRLREEKEMAEVIRNI